MAMEKILSNLISSLREAIRVPLRFHWSVLVLPTLLIIVNGVLGIPLFIIIFASLLFHEYSHVWMSQRQGVYISHVITHGFGAAAMIEMIDLTDYKLHLKISIAGPAGSFLLACLGVLLHSMFHSIWTLYFIYINLLLGAFNLLPLFPSDGGRVFYSILGMKFGARKALKIAVAASWLLCGCGIVYGLLIGSPWIVVIMGLLMAMSVREKRISEDWLNSCE